MPIEGMAEPIPDKPEQQGGRRWARTQCRPGRRLAPSMSMETNLFVDQRVSVPGYGDYTQIDTSNVFHEVDGTLSKCPGKRKCKAKKAPHYRSAHSLLKVATQLNLQRIAEQYQEQIETGRSLTLRIGGTGTSPGSDRLGVLSPRDVAEACYRYEFESKMSSPDKKTTTPTVNLDISGTVNLGSGIPEVSLERHRVARHFHSAEWVLRAAGGAKVRAVFTQPVDWDLQVINLELSQLVRGGSGEDKLPAMTHDSDVERLICRDLSTWMITCEAELALTPIADYYSRLPERDEFACMALGDWSYHDPKKRGLYAGEINYTNTGFRPEHLRLWDAEGPRWWYETRLEEMAKVPEGKKGHLSSARVAEAAQRTMADYPVHDLGLAPGLEVFEDNPFWAMSWRMQLQRDQVSWVWRGQIGQHTLQVAEESPAKAFIAIRDFMHTHLPDKPKPGADFPSMTRHPSVQSEQREWMWQHRASFLARMMIESKSYQERCIAGTARINELCAQLEAETERRFQQAERHQ